MSDVNDAGQALSVGDYAEDYLTFEQQRQPGAAAADVKDEKTAEADAGDGDESKNAGADTAAAEKKTEPEGEDGDESDDDAGEKPRKKGGWQRKIEKAERENAELRERLARVEGTLAGNPAKGAPGDKSATDAAKPAESWTGKPEPVAKDFDSYEAYTKALTTWQWDELKAQEAAEQRKESAAKTQREAAQKFVARAKEVAKKYDDFEEAVNSSLEVTPAVYHAMIGSEHGPEIGYHLAKNPAEAERLNKLSPEAMFKEIGKLEARFATTPNQKPRVSTAPDPIRPVSARSSTRVASIDDPDIDFADFERKANKRFSR